MIASAHVGECLAIATSMEIRVSSKAVEGSDWKTYHSIKNEESSYKSKVKECLTENSNLPQVDSEFLEGYPF